MTSIAFILLLIALAWFWLDSSRAREFAVEICRQASEKYGVQFLDESVVLKKFGLRWPSEGLRFHRVYAFYFSRNGEERLAGKMALIGTRLDYLDFDFSIIDAASTKQSPRPIQNGNIIPIRKNSPPDSR